MKASGPLPILLAPLSWLFGGAVRLRNWSYDAGLASVRRLPIPVLSVGNLSVGGTGKTPVVILLARLLAEEGHRPAVVLRGYGGSNARQPGGPPLLVADGTGPLALTDAEIAGDEALLLATTLENIPVIVAADRYRGGMEAIRTCRAETVILDDGFQHRALHRDFNLVTMDASVASFPGRLLPAGRLRESLRALHRCQAVLLTRADDDADFDLARQAIVTVAPELPIYRCRHRATRLRWLGANDQDPPSLAHLRDLPVAAFAGLARPQVLEETLSDLGARVVQFTPLPDHHHFRPGQVDQLVTAGQAAGAQLIVTTAKDAARLARTPLPHPLAVLEIEVQVENLPSLLASIFQHLKRPSHVEGRR